jgi:uncharacterized protein (UPF0276 family)
MSTGRAPVSTLADQDREGATAPGRLRLGFTYEGGEPALLERIVPIVDYLEITPDSIARQHGGVARLDPAIIDELHAIEDAVDLVVHGVGLSIGSASGYSSAYLDLVEDFLADFPQVMWHSEHLGYTEVDGTSLGTMLAMPKTHDVLDLVAGRIDEIQARIPLPFLLENIVHLLPDYPGDYTDAAFLNELVARTGCGLLLDVYNVECDAANYGFDIGAFFDELNLDAVRELHLAGGVELGGMQVDVHSRPTRPSTLALARQALARVPADAAVTYELLPEAVPALGEDVIVEELTRIRSALTG